MSMSGVHLFEDVLSLVARRCRCCSSSVSCWRRLRQASAVEGSGEDVLAVRGLERTPRIRAATKWRWSWVGPGEDTGVLPCGAECVERALSGGSHRREYKRRWEMDGVDVCSVVNTGIYGGGV